MKIIIDYDVNLTINQIKRRSINELVAKNQTERDRKETKRSPSDQNETYRNRSIPFRSFGERKNQKRSRTSIKQEVQVNSINFNQKRKEMKRNEPE